ncbi:MAG: cytochrome P450 [Mycobacterium sp.]
MTASGPATPRATSTPRCNPPVVRTPRLVQGVQFAIFRRRAMHTWIERHGRIFEINVPIFGRSVVVSDPTLVKSVCTTSTEQLINIQPNLNNLFGPGSVFGFDGPRHRDRRRLLAPAFHGQRLENYEKIIEDETLRESANWPEDNEFRTLEPMNRITLNVILRTVFGSAGAECNELEELREIIPPFMKLAQVMAFVPAPPFWARRYRPWRKLDEFRNAFDRIVSTLIDRASADPDLGERSDVLASLLRSGYDDGTTIPRRDLSDELLTLVCAGHETTAAVLAWTFERLRRNPDVLAELVGELDEGGSDFRRATIFEVLRVCSVVDVIGRRVTAPGFDLGAWRIPQDRTVFVRIADLHENPEAFPHPERFDPSRFRATKPAAPAWLAFSGGTRRCIGADFTIAEIDIVLRTVLRNFVIRTDGAADEKSYFRGVAHIPKRGGRIVVNRRRQPAEKRPLCRPS